jgi:pimeloyl-ACP methyl ester carboxylesterase
MQDAKQIQTGFVETNGTQLYYEMMGEGHPLVLLHGGYMDRRMWDDQFRTFAQYYRVIRYDIRGFGKSELPQIAYSDRRDLYDLLTHLGIEKAYLLGLSLGGGIAIDFTLEHPERVDALVLVGSNVTGAPIPQILTQEEIQVLIGQQQPMQAAISSGSVSAMLDAVMNHPTLVPSEDYPSARQRVRENLSEYSFVWVLNPAPRQELEPPAWGRLREIAVPTLIVVGEDDSFLLHRFADQLEREIADAKRVKIPGTHHMPNMEKPEEFNRIVLDFLKML